jgi:hypothetical protein
MVGDGGENLDDTVEEIENAPQPAEDREAAARTPAGGEDAGGSLVRNAYRARRAASDASSAAGFSRMETGNEGVLVRGAYLKHLAEGQSEAAGEHDRGADDTLRRAYLARMDAEPKPRRPRKSAAPAKKGIAKKGAAKKAPARAASRSKTKAKARGRSKPRVARTARSKRRR